MQQAQLMEMFATSRFTSGSAANMFIQGDTLFSRYQSFDAFPLARRILRTDGTNALLVNGDLPDGARGARNPGWGRTTVGNPVSRNHQWMTFNSQLYRDQARVPFSLLGEGSANLDARLCQLVSHQRDENGNWAADYDTDTMEWRRNEQGELVNHEGKTLREAVPAGAVRRDLRDIPAGTKRADDVQHRWLGATITSDFQSDTREVTQATYHRIGTAVLRDLSKGDGEDYLCSMDESTYFISRLPRQTVDVSDAFNALKPEAVLRAEAAAKTVRRQGEWFFIRLDSDTLYVPVTQVQHPYDLPRTTDASNIHRCENGFTGQTLTGRDPRPSSDGLHARGAVVHVQPDGVTESREHAPLSLGNDWYGAHRNTSLADWTIPNNSSRGPMVD